MDISPEVLPYLVGILIFVLWKLGTMTREHRCRQSTPPNDVSTFKVWLRVGETWANTIVAVFMMIVAGAAASFVAFELVGPRATVLLLRGALTLSLVMFVLSELIIVLLTRAERVSSNPDKEEKYPRVSQAVQRLYKRNGWLMKKPRLYVCSLGEIPNAFAFGMGIFGQYAVAVTPPLYELLDDDELESVIAHEIAHIRHKDVGLLTVVSILTGLCKSLASAVKANKSPTGQAAYIALEVLNRVIFPIGMGTISCEREFSADALGALYKGEPKSAVKALQKLEEEFKNLEASPKSLTQEILGPLTQSHPNMSLRYDSLKALNQN